jgi:hypothetical protein
MEVVVAVVVTGALAMVHLSKWVEQVLAIHLSSATNWS